MNKTKELVVLALLAALLFVQEQALTFLPNIQLTVFLLILYAKHLGCVKTMIIVLLHVLLDNLIMGSMNPLFMTFTFIGWSLIPIGLTTVFKSVSSNMGLAFTAIVFALLYCWIYIIPNIVVYQIDAIAYFMSDLPFAGILAVSSFLSTLWLYEPCSKVFAKYL